ncbi:MAG: DNA recombination protein RmuC [Pyrinomonadaceae bacterium]
MQLFIIIASFVLLVVLIVLIRRSRTSENLLKVFNRLDTLEKGVERVERTVRDESSSNRQMSTQEARSLRDEVSIALKNFNDSIVRFVSESASGNKQELSTLGESLRGQVNDIATLVVDQLKVVPNQLTVLTKSNEEKLESLRSTVDEQLRVLKTDNGARLDQVREASKQDSRSQREEVNASLKHFSETLIRGLSEMADNQRNQSQSVVHSLETGFTAMRGTLNTNLKEIQESNSLKLEEMRLTVDEKLHGTLEKRLGEAFGLVTGQLEQVHKGLGEMQTLATGVGDLKRALTNIKTRGGWSEVQLGALMEDMLSPTQYDRNFKPNEGADTIVEYAIKFPNRDGSGEPVWLPIDSKFPIEDYNRLVDAQEKADLDAINAATKGLETRIKGCAKDICEKYLNPPRTTDFGMMFLPTEGLYAEVIRRASLVETVRRDYNVTIVGPSTFAAFVSSLQMGFRTLAIQERSSEVWKLLGAVKTQFGKFGAVLDGVKKKLEQATNTMDDAAIRTRAIERKLRDVEELPATEALVLLGETERDEGAEAA